jgi:hypothetical protein
MYIRSLYIFGLLVWLLIAAVQTLVAQPEDWQPGYIGGRPHLAGLGKDDKHTSILPFTASPDFLQEWPIQVAFKGLKKDKILYDKAIAIIWSGENDNQIYVESCDVAAKTFHKAGFEVHTFLPEKDRRFYARDYDVAKTGVDFCISHNANTDHLKALVESIPTQYQGQKVLIQFFFTSHGSPNAISGPDFGDSPANLIAHNIYMRLMEHMAATLKHFDVRTINACCYGSNHDDFFQQSYLKARTAAGLSDDSTSCSSVLAAWSNSSVSNGNKPWEASFLSGSKNLSFLQASHEAMKRVRLGRLQPRYEDPNSYLYNLSDYYALENGPGNNIGMTTSERILYYEILVRNKVFVISARLENKETRKFEKKYWDYDIKHWTKKYTDWGWPQIFIPQNGADELQSTFFDLSKANLAIPIDSPFTELCKESVIQTEAFLANLNLSLENRKYINLKEDGKIDFEAVSNFLKQPRVAHEIAGRDLAGSPSWSLGWVNKIIKNEIMTRPALLSYLHEIGQPNEDGILPNKVEIRSVYSDDRLMMTKSEILKAVKKAERDMEAIYDDDYHQLQVALVVIKRLGLMLDFLNRPDVPLRLKELFAYYRAAELRPLFPAIKMDKVSVPPSRFPTDR